MNDAVSATPPRNTGVRCPFCAVDLSVYERQGIEIDYCPKCRGVWLDRGELDKIIERSVVAAPSTAPQVSPQQSPSGHEQGYDRSQARHHGGGHGGHGYKGRKRSFLSELFD